MTKSASNAPCPAWCPGKATHIVDPDGTVRHKVPIGETIIAPEWEDGPEPSLTVLVEKYPAGSMAVHNGYRATYIVIEAGNGEQLEISPDEARKHAAHLLAAADMLDPPRRPRRR